MDIIEIAQEIAKRQHLPLLEQGLPPREDYEQEGRSCPGLETHYQQASLAFNAAIGEWHTETMTRWHVLREAARIYFYSRQLEAVSGQPLWPVAYASIRLQGISNQEVEVVAETLYTWQAQHPMDQQDDAEELAHIQQAVEAEVSQEQTRRGPGRPLVHTQPMARLELTVTADLKRALVDAKAAEMNERPMISLGQIVEECLREHPLIRRFLAE